MTKYINWVVKQTKEFQDEIGYWDSCASRFIDYKAKPMTLDELVELDKKHNIGADDDDKSN